MKTLLAMALSAAIFAAPAYAGGTTIENDANAESGSQSGSWSSVTVEGNAAQRRVTGQIGLPLNGGGNWTCDRWSGPVSWSSGTNCVHQSEADYVGGIVKALHSPDPATRAGARAAMYTASRQDASMRRAFRGLGYIR